METTGPSFFLPAQMVGNTFVEQYYRILHTSPHHLVHKFYQDSSMLSRPGSDNLMTSVTTMQEINSKMLSFGLKDYKPEILSADAQYSYKEGVIVLVTGCLIRRKDNMRRKFSQTFFLARQDKGYYVLNDVFRFVDDDEPLGVASAMSPDPEPAHVPDQPLQNHTSTTHDEELSNNGNVVPTSVVEVSNNGEVCDPSDTSHSDVEVVIASSSQSDVRSVAESASNVRENAQKISYAAALMKENTMTSPVHVPTSSTVRAESSSTEQQSPAPARLKAAAPRSISASQNSYCHAKVKGIYIGNLPIYVTVKQLEAEFKIFGPIKRDGGIQVRRFKEDGFCYGFIEFESSNSAHSAIQAHKIRIGNKVAHIEEKRIATQGNGTGREKFSSGRGGFYGDNLKGWRNSGGGQGFQNGGGRAARHSAMK